MIEKIVLARGALFDWVKQTPLAPLFLVLTAYVVYNFFRPLPPHQGRALFLLFVFAAVFLQSRPGGDSRYLRWFDYTLTLLSIVVFGYIVVYHSEISMRSGEPTNIDFIMGLIAVALTIEGTRRGMGNSLAIVVCIFLAYFAFGHFIPVGYGYHTEFSPEDIVNAVYLEIQLDGIFGLSTYVFFNYIFLFFLYGNVLMSTNASVFVMDFIRAIVGTRRGGAAMGSVVGSGALGSISGLSMGNVMITGVITIPLMKKTGFKPWVAAAVEAAASSGGQVMPPVMGTVAFLMMSFLGMQYMDIVKAAIIPAILFYLALLASVYFYSIRIGATGVEESEVPKLREVIKRKEAFTFISSFLVLLTLITLKYSPMYAVLCAIGTALVVSFFTPSRLSVKKIGNIITQTGAGFVGLGAAGAGLGIVIASTLQTGFAFRITSMLLEWTGGLLIPTLLAVFLACFILGMGLPPIIVYVVSILLGAPALINLGIDPLAAHLFCFYAAVSSEITPPIASAAFVASMVAETNFWMTCMYSMMFGGAALILPFAFALDNSLLLVGSISGISLATSKAVMGVILVSWGIAGGVKRFSEVLPRVMIGVSGLLLLFSGAGGYWMVTISIILALLGGALTLLKKKQNDNRVPKKVP